MEHFDAIIVGGGPSGSICASYLALAGWRVAIMEQASFPRHQIGESMLPWTRQVLTDIGFDEICQREGLIVKRGAIFHSERTGAAKNFDFSETLNPKFASAYSVDRSQFDSLLLGHAASLGVELIQPCRFASARRTPTGYCVNDTWTADLVVMAAGTATKSLFPQRYITNRDQENRSAVFGYFPAPKSGPYHHLFGNISINIFYLDDSQRQPYWSWATPIHADEISVGFVLPTAACKKLRAQHPDDSALIEALFAANRFQRQFVAPSATLLRPLHTRVNFQRIPESIVDDHMLFVGDAAGFIDPVFSSGVHLGALSAKYAATHAIAVKAKGQPLDRENLLPYQNSYLHHFWLYYRFVAAFYQKNVVEKIFLSARYTDDEEAQQKQREFSALLAGDSHSANALFDMIIRSRVAIDPAVTAIFSDFCATSTKGERHDHYA